MTEGGLNAKVMAFDAVDESKRASVDGDRNVDGRGRECGRQLTECIECDGGRRRKRVTAVVDMSWYEREGQMTM